MTDIFNPQKVQKAFLTAVQLPQMSDSETQQSLKELARLVNTLGYEVIGQTSQKRPSEKSALVFGEGKLKDIAKWTGGTGTVSLQFVKKKHKAALKKEKLEAEKQAEEDELQDADELDADLIYDMEDDGIEESSAPAQDIADILVVDCELSPSQIRNLESASGVRVLDRTGVIIEIFSRHAKTKAAKLQVEIARLKYIAPRIRESLMSEDRQGGGGGKGAGETDLELDRRQIRDRVKELRLELENITDAQDMRRARREQEKKVALVGYTNAGKSSLMRALTSSEIYVADKLFATLDTTIRTLHPEIRPKILVSDTVGFIKKLPHNLVASFKSTLDEALSASLLFYVVDCADPAFKSQLEVTKKVLDEVGAQEIPSKLVLNKIDQLTPDQLAELKNEYPDAYFISTRSTDDIQTIRQNIISFFEESMVEHTFLIPYDVKGPIGDIRQKMKVLNEEYGERGLSLKVIGSEIEIKNIRKKYGI